MSHHFSENIDSFDLWKSEINRSLSRFRIWLRRNELYSDAMDNRLFRLQESLKNEYLTLAFVGEFSRGKTELINALFFSQYGQRILPSEAGRTTMCPTELFYDRKENRPYLRLLPIETRLDSTTLSEYRNLPSLWTEVPLMTGSAQEMTYALHTITQTKAVSVEEAVNLGFDKKLLETSHDDKTKVEIPAWRHALVSFPHDLLKRGLCILDTPGLNALGSEPELTLKLLPQVQAVVFMLGADTGVTASDMQIWDSYIKSLNNESSLALFAVLNKIDTLWDELSSRKKIEKAIVKMVETTARQLQLPANRIIPISAQKALVAKVKNDKSLLARSQIDELETLLSHSLLTNKETIIWDSVVSEAKRLIEDAMQVLTVKSEKIQTQREELTSLTGKNKDHVQELIEANKQVMKDFEHRLVAVRPSQRLLERQTQILLSCVSNSLLSKEVEVTLNELVNSRTTLGLFRHMRQFFISINNMMKEMTREAELTNKMVISLYDKFSKDFGMTLFEPKLFPARKLNRKLEAIIRRSERLDNNIFTTLTEHSIAVKRFFSGTVTEVMAFFKTTRHDLIEWTQDVVTPLTQQLKLQQKLIANYQVELAELSKSRSNIEGKIKGLNNLLHEIDMETQTAAEIINNLDARKKPSNQTNIVQFRRA